MKTVLVTGGAGFIGSNLIGSLLKSGYKIACVDNFDDTYDLAFKEEHIKPFLKDKNFKLYKVDIRSLDDLKKIFEEEKVLLSATIGEWTVVIEHIGSTSVKGLGAKPIIDMVACVETLKIAEECCISQLEGIGYKYMPEFEKLIPERRFFRKYFWQKS